MFCLTVHNFQNFYFRYIGNFDIINKYHGTPTFFNLNLFVNSLW